MTTFIQSVDERTRLAGANKLEVLLFSLGTDPATGRQEAYGINVFKVREVMKTPVITHAPDMPPGVQGMVSLRGAMVPVINLAYFCGIHTEEPPSILMITEYNKSINGFLVHSVEHILRMEWNQLRTPPAMMAHSLGGLITAVTELDDGRIVMILDVEKILAETTGLAGQNQSFTEVKSLDIQATVLFADDSSIARKQIQKTLDQMGVEYYTNINGAEAWTKLQELANQAEQTHVPLLKLVQVVLTDIEMPEMDGYVLTKKIKEDARFNDLKIVMHSSLSADTNIKMGTQIGADAYVAKFNAVELSKAIKPFLETFLNKP